MNASGEFDPGGRLATRRAVAQVFRAAPQALRALPEQSTRPREHWLQNFADFKLKIQTCLQTARHVI